MFIEITDFICAGEETNTATTENTTVITTVISDGSANSQGTDFFSFPDVF